MTTLFRKPILYLLCALTLMSACLCGCTPANEKGFPVPVSDHNRSAFELTDKKHRDAELEEIYALMSERKDINELNKQYAIECLRKDENGYRVIYVGKHYLLVLYFDSNAQWIEREKLQSFFLSCRSRAPFDEIQPGDPIAKVQTADATCYYPFLLDRGDYALESDHYTDDGYHTHITYNEDLTVKTIDTEIA